MATAVKSDEGKVKTAEVVKKDVVAAKVDGIPDPLKTLVEDKIVASESVKEVRVAADSLSIHIGEKAATIEISIGSAKPENEFAAKIIGVNANIIVSAAVPAGPAMSAGVVVTIVKKVESPQPK